MNARDRIEWLLYRRRKLRMLFCNDQDELTPEAMVFFKWLCRFCHAERSSYRQNPQSGVIDPYATHVAEGRREVWNELQRLMNLDAKKLIQELKQLEEDETWQTKS